MSVINVINFNVFTVARKFYIKKNLYDILYNVSGPIIAAKENDK